MNFALRKKTTCTRATAYCAFGMALLLLVPKLANSLLPPTRSLFLRLPRQVQRQLSASKAPWSRDLDEDSDYNDSGYSRPVVQWYPGHIAKAERELSRTLKAVDVVVEVRDARAITATSHPLVATWCAGLPRIVALTRGDQVPSKARLEWKSYFEAFGATQSDEVLNRLVENQAKQARQERSKYSPQNSQVRDTMIESVLFVNGATGAGIPALKRAIIKSGIHVQERRRRRGLLPRPLRVGLLGYPNTGKSSILNKLLGVRRAPTSNRPGVTRTLQWIRVKDADDLEMLDSPGVIPATLVDQSDATLLAACNCIGSAAYDNQAVAAYLCQWLLTLHRNAECALAAPEWSTNSEKRYKLDPLQLQDVSFSGEDFLFTVAENTCKGNQEDAARKILQDFRTGRMGPVCLQLAPTTLSNDRMRGPSVHDDERDQRIGDQQALEQQRAQMAKEMAAQIGLELPSIIADHSQPSKPDASQVGKGLFEGW